MHTPLTAKELAELLRIQTSGKFKEVDPTTLRYALYARKSTTGDERQAWSIDDQISDCLDRQINPHNLRVVDTFMESESAKDSGIRPLFKQMVEGLKHGKYDGVIAWHPDRLARNMKDAGEIIDLLDKGAIKDLRFATFTFENSPMGKMLLGVSFVLSKQYTDHLSESVLRGNRRRIEAGIYISDAKHGYYKGSDGRMYPDGDNWLLIKNAFRMRLAGTDNFKIADFLTTNGYKRSTWEESKRIDAKRVSEIMKDPFYAGVLIYGESVVALEDVYDFTPVVSVEEFLQLNKLGSNEALYKLANLNRRPGDVKANLMRKMVICGACGKFMSTGISTKPKKNERRLLYRCNTFGCPRRNKSTRAKVVLDFIYDFLDKQYFASEQGFLSYKEEMLSLARNRGKSIASEQARLGLQRRQLIEKYEKTKKLIINSPAALKKHLVRDLDKLDAEIENLRIKLEDLKEEKHHPEKLILDYEEFLELMRSSGEILRKTPSLKSKDEIIRKIFSNLTVSDGKVVDYRLNEPFSTLFDSTNPAWQG